ncbi:kinase-like domain-containing protein [Daedaleopsis nitida]|nr:kinase-like domain-containing protein [Daedaleopsis nitida]
MRIRYDKMIGSGSYGAVFEGAVTGGRFDGEVIAVKRSHTARSIVNPILRHEACALHLLRGKRNIPKVYCWGTSNHYEYLGMQKLERTLTCYFIARDGVSLRNLAAIAYQLIDAIEFVHARGIIHGDIHPGNLMFADKDGTQGVIYLVDFGLSSRWYTTGRDDVVALGVRGTVLYASLNSHLHKMLSRRDDMESLAYTILHFLLGSVPWISAWVDENIKAVYAAKKAFSASSSLREFPSIFGKLVEGSRALAYTEDPPYKAWKKEFLSLLAEQPLSKFPLFDPKDTTAPRITYSELQQPTIGEPVANWEQEVPDEELCPDPISPDSDGLQVSSESNLICLSEEFLLGDEARIVREGVERIEAVPEAKSAWVAHDERMRV